jgi:plastocyanin
MNMKYWVVVSALSLGIALPLRAENLPAIYLTIKDGRYSPEQMEIPAGQKIKLVIKNDGPGPEEFESSDLNREKLIKAGKTAEVSIGPLNPGTYKFFGEFHPQTAQGRIVAK